MGLATTHGAWHGSYSAFGSWRKWIAKIRGFNLLNMVGFGGDQAWSEAQKQDPLYPLLSHSDCDGELSPKECALVALGLSQIILDASQYLEPDMNYLSTGEHNYHIAATKAFRKGCIDAIKKNESIIFS